MPPRLIDITTHSTHIMAINTHGMINTAIIAWKKWLYRYPLDPYEGCFALISLATLHLYHDCTDVNKFQKNKLPIARTYETSTLRWHYPYHDLFSSYHDGSSLHLPHGVMTQRSPVWAPYRIHITPQPHCPHDMTALYLLHIMKQVLLLAQPYTGLISRLDGVHIKTIMYPC